MYIHYTMTITTDRAQYTLSYDVTENQGAHNIFLYRMGDRQPLLEMATIQDNILAVGQKCVLHGYRNYLLASTYTQIDLGVIRTLNIKHYQKKAV